LQAIEEHALTSEAIEAVIQLSEHDDLRDAQAKLERERTDVQKRIDRVVAAVESGGNAAALVAKLRELEARKAAIDIEATGLRPIPRLPPAVIESRLAEWRRMLRASTTQGRTVLQRVLSGRITFSPLTDELGLGQTGYDFSSPTRYDKLFTGVATPRPKDLNPNDRAGLEDIGPGDTQLESDYGRLLERAMGSKTAGKGWCARRDLNPRPTGSKPGALSS
jgi:hypothetical protein